MLQSTGLGKLAPTGAPKGNARGTPAPLVVSVRDATALTGWCEWQLHKLIREGKLKSCKPFGRRLIYMSEINRLLGIKPAEQP
jgi:hypothetical protein